MLPHATTLPDLSSLNIFDIVIALVIGWGVLSGISRGLINEVAGMLGIFVGLWMAGPYAERLVPTITPFVGGTLAYPIGFGIVVFIIYGIVTALGQLMTAIVNATIVFGWLNSLLGAVFGGIRSLLWVQIGITIVMLVGYRNLLASSQLARVIYVWFPIVLQFLPPTIQSVIHGFLPK